MILMVIRCVVNTTSSAIIYNNGGNRRMVCMTVLAFQRERSFVRRRIPFSKTVEVLSTSGCLLASSPLSHKEGITKFPSNQEIVERRLEVNRAKRKARERSVQKRESKNLRIKRLLHSESNNRNFTSSSTSKTTLFEIPPLYAVKVLVDKELREELKLSGREKRGRVFLEAGSEGTTSFRGLKDEMFGFFRALRKNTFLLTANLPLVDESGTIMTVPLPLPKTGEDTFYNLHWKIENDEDVINIFALADEYFRNSTSSTSSTMKRPSIQINVRKDPNAPPPLPPPAYLSGMPDPVEATNMTILSFYAFPPMGISDPEEFANKLKKIWKPFRALGRIYVAHEGVNAQMSVPTNVLSHFVECCLSIQELGQYMENGINIDPKPLSQKESAAAFRNLHIRVRNQVVADGLNESLDWQSAGYDMPPLEWHERLKQDQERIMKLKNKLDDSNENDETNHLPILLDCRNTYETDVGIFEGAEPLETTSFRDSWDVLKEKLRETPKDAPIMTYCTGGIRCVKVGAYLTQEMGFTNVSRLAGGIIAYDRTLNEKKEREESMFKGTNFVFDGRLGRKITDDDLGNCITCGAETSLVTNCRNSNCHTRMIQCETCRTNYQGTCSIACKTRLVNGSIASRRFESTKLMKNKFADEQKQERRYENLDDYSLGHSSPISSIYKGIELNTQAYLASGSHMVSGAAQGRLLTQLASMTRNGRILELGTFTGYSAACLLEGARNVGLVLGADESKEETNVPYVLTMERDSLAFNLAAAHFQIISNFGFDGEQVIEAMCALRNKNLKETQDNLLSFSVDGIVRCDLLRVTDALATLETMADDHLTAPFDLIFVDADKTRLLEYVEAALSSDKLLARGGLIVVDNVLWKGLVLEASTGEFTSASDTIVDKFEVRKNRRARKLATTMHHFNSAIAKDDRVEVMVLPMRDGLSLIRKK